MRRHRPEEHLNHEAWAIPYADLMTLLLAFFVVMYAVSVVNEGKFRVMSASLIQAFNGAHGGVAQPAAVHSTVNTPAVVSVDHSAAARSVVALPMPTPPKPVPEANSQPPPRQQNLDTIENQVRHALQPLIDRNLVVMRHKQDGLEIEIRTDILFPSGVAQLSSSADVVLQKLAAILAPFPNPLRVEGFTDNVPISTPQYPSNWELSAGRAASVARLFAVSGVAPERLGIIGWGEVRPRAENTTVEGRNQNRRVVVVVMNTTTDTPRQPSEVAQLGQLASAAATPPAGAGLPVAAPPPAPSVVHVTAGSAADAAGVPAAAAARVDAQHAGPSISTVGGLSDAGRPRVSPDR
ncbi:MAG: flagellar motor protein MotD [Rhodanobacter sp.]